MLREATDLLDLPLPSDGHLLFFHDPADMEDDGEVMYVPAGTTVAERHGCVIPWEDLAALRFARVRVIADLDG
ncbi:hypothetical protein [Streptomyces sp. NPDC055287]